MKKIILLICTMFFMSYTVNVRAVPVFKTKSQIKKEMAALSKEYQDYREEMERRVNVLMEKIEKDKKIYDKTLENLKKKYQDEIYSLQETIMEKKKNGIDGDAEQQKIKNSISVELKDYLEKKKIILIRKNKIFSLRIPSDIIIDKNKKISKEGLELIRQTSYIVNKFPEYYIDIEWGIFQKERPSSDSFRSGAELSYNILVEFINTVNGKGVRLKSSVSWRPETSDNKNGTFIFIHLYK